MAGNLIKTAAGMGLAVVIGLAVPALAHADPDPSDYYAWLRRDGILVDGNESYLLGLARMVCDMKNAGYELSDIGHYIAKRENVPNIKGYDIAADADIQYCTMLHPRLVP